MWKDYVPFVAAGVIVLFSPALDEILWRQAYMRFYEQPEMDLGKVSVEDLTNSVQWAVDMAALYAGVFLSWVGVLLVAYRLPVIAVVGTMIVFAMPALLAAARASKLNLHERRRLVSWLPYTPLEALTVLFNGLCLLGLPFLPA